MKRIKILSSGSELVEKALDSLNSKLDEEIEIKLINPILKNKVLRYLRAFHLKTNIPFKNIWIKKYVKKNFDIIIIFDVPIWFENLEYIRKINKKTKIVLWYWNIVRNKKYLLKAIKYCDYVCTFDKKDSEKYNILQLEQFYWERAKENKKIENDVFFIGKNKKRLEEIEEILMKLESSKIKYEFYVVGDNKKEKSQLLELKNENLEYEKVIDKILKSEAILDIPQKNQHGLTLRVLETLFFNKKLITTNKDIKNYDFYNENNIFILEKNTTGNEIKAFLDKKMEKIDEKIKNKYTVEEWFKKIINLGD